MSKKQITLICVGLVLTIILAVITAFFLLADEKSPDAYTWDEYLNMSGEEQEELFQRFDSLDDFEAWKESVQIPPGSLQHPLLWRMICSLGSDMMHDWRFPVGMEV